MDFFRSPSIATLEALPEDTDIRGRRPARRFDMEEFDRLDDGYGECHE